MTPSKILLLGAGLLALSAGAAAAQAPTLGEALAGCTGVASAACVTQIGDGNRATLDQRQATNSRAFVFIEGDRNGRGGTFGGVSGQVLNNYDAAKDTKGFGDDGEEDAWDDNDGWDAEYVNPVTGARGRSAFLVGGDAEAANPTTTTMDLAAVESGVIRQKGDDNIASVAVLGNDNRFHVSQDGDNNQAFEVVLGDDNGAAVVQTGDGHFALELQAGSGNLAHVVQSDPDGMGPNIAILAQVGGGVPSAASLANASFTSLASASTAAALGGANGNRILLEQTGGAEAYLLQVGARHGIALKQTTGATATISQFGTGQQIALNQQGSTPIQITQFGFR